MTYGAGNDDRVALCTEGTARSEITKGVIEDIFTHHYLPSRDLAAHEGSAHRN